MEDIIVIVVIVALVAVGIYSAVKHLKRRSGCCGSGDYRPKKKKLPKVLYKKTFKVSGMHCEHCKGRVEEVVNDIPGVAGSVNLKRGELTVSYAQDVEDDAIRRKLERVGYTME